jgi:hypothetical protein
MASKLKVKKKFDLKKKIATFENTVVKVGFPKESQESKAVDTKGISAVYKASIHNFGLGVPKRPFMNLAFAKNKKAYQKIILKNFKNIKDLNMIEFSNKLGVKAQGDVQREIVSLRSPANSDLTVKIKGSSNPLIDTGHMLQSVTYQVIKKV